MQKINATHFSLNHFKSTYDLNQPKYWFKVFIKCLKMLILPGFAIANTSQFTVHWMEAIPRLLLINLYMCTLYFSNNLIACIKAFVHALLFDCRVWKRWPAPDGCSGDSIRMQGSLSPLSPSPCIEQLWWFHLHTNNQPGLRQPPSVWLLLSLVSPAV